MTQTRRQVNQLKAGDRVSVQLSVCFDVTGVLDSNGDVNSHSLQVKPRSLR